ncbi:PREDICTED: neuropeptide-like protein C4orf48 homolog isoform X1 [Nanorana parkeri]|uniref:neuropeptide-like protein C4orf48 homolog isoform X1 n=1 Tax=Nanorana parkeri TaxID=125878 RepID=UPI000854C90D|nr:PREDICTED: neuropeptide-like protein C4orf48 homolog isoform X1 [Nanorana parkeri]
MGILHSNDPTARKEYKRSLSAMYVTSDRPSRLQQHSSVPKIFIMFCVAVLVTFLGLVQGTFVVTSLAEKMTGSLSEQGTIVPAEIRPCVDCHAFEFMERALQDINTAANNLDLQTEKLLLRTEQRSLCDCTV